MSEPWTYEDGDGDPLTIRLAAGGARIQLVDEWVIIPPHDLAKVVARMYAVIGHAVPDLPEIIDPAQVEAMAQILANCFDSKLGYEENARALLAAGVRLP